jgi:hypothetical protein
MITVEVNMRTVKAFRYLGQYFCFENISDQGLR